MKIFICTLAFFVLFINTSFAQKNKKSKTKKATVKKQLPKKVYDDNTIPLLVKKGSDEIFVDLKMGTKFIYEVNDGLKKYNFTVTVLTYDYIKGIVFDFAMLHNGSKGRVTIDSNMVHNGNKYVNQFGNGDLNLVEATTVWLSGKNFGDMPDKKTVMQLDEGVEELFFRQTNDEVAHEIKLDGKKVKINAFQITNNENDGVFGDKTITVHGISSNPLIVKMNLGWTITLKEIISRK